MDPSTYQIKINCLPRPIAGESLKKGAKFSDWKIENSIFKRYLSENSE